jgi:hypothetical protein
LRRFLSLLLPVTVLLISSAAALAEDLEIINRPVNTSGLTGLLFTTAPLTLPPRSVEIGVATLSENSTVPNYSVGELPSLSITAGIAQGMELALKGSYFHKTVNEGNKARGAGDTELSYKWNFLPQTESSSFPALALIIAGIAPTSSRDLDLGGVAHWGTRFGLTAGREITWGDHVIGVYADGQMAVHDLSDQRFRDRYGILNAGLLLPISKYRNLQMLIEYNLVTGIDKISDAGGDYSAVTYGLRLVSEKFNLTIGTQFMHKKVPGFENSNRIIGMTSIKF